MRTFAPKQAGGQRTGDRAAPASVHTSGAKFEGPAPLPSALRYSLESYFHASLDGVRVYSDAASQAAAERLQASAFTIGRNIHLGREGVRASGAAKAGLLAHEVVHTLQQGPAGQVRPKMKVGALGDRFETQADVLAAGFSRFNRNPNDAIALGVRDSTPIGHVLNDAPVIQRSRVATHFGEFEDARYGDLTDAAGTKVGVEMFLKFHPGTNVRADLIGLTQAAEGKHNGTQITQGIYGVHSATAGAGVGSFIDRVEGRVNPLYGSTNVLKAGGKADELEDYEMTAPTALSAAEQTTLATATGIVGMTRRGGGKHGFRKVVSQNYVTQAAELYDAPALSPSGANSEQVFETTALGLAGSQEGTYYGSVEWGWRKDAAGAFSRVPFRVISQGVPSATFLTAASIWNPSKASFGFVATSATDLIRADGTRIAAIPNAAELVPTGRQAAAPGGARYIEVTHGGNTGFVVSTAVKAAAIGAATVDLPVPMIHTVTNPAGTTMIHKSSGGAPAGGPGTRTLALPKGTRLRTTRCMVSTAALPDHYEGTIVDGPHIGTSGFFSRPDLTLEALGTR